ncbi:putative potassium transport system protein kup 2 [Agaricicola taiwanensis]|uniref:Probable potassium transport system protein Kup n=2 Tax=Agaricicola taiwanensis TaxID=591372 RepID=A0A8J2YJM3_9RHOB|nr:putative potassium transport system protein kup 2 [Agaricicola taiwanensis]
MLGSIGIVYGDIGTSPLYAMRESLLHIGRSPSQEEIIGIVSLLVWSLLVVVTLKYVFLVLRADNHGEGGTLALMALAQSSLKKPSRIVTGLAVTGAALFYGDAILTPAISVLSAVEGLKVTNPEVDSFVVPIAITIIVLLYAVQSFGTGKVGALFGPIMTVWFLALALIGLIHIGDAPQILHALNPVHAIGFLFGHGIIGFTVLGAVFLAVTGAEALYADMGHFGRGPIRMAWLTVVCPSLVLNYLGQGAFALDSPEAISNLFFLSAPDWARLPLVLLATAATVIAGQAVITGAFSLTRQAMQLGILPHLEVEHTSETESGQIYLPKVNWLMLAGVLTLIIVFQDSSSLASAYGIAVTGTMIVTSLLAVVVVAKCWKWGMPLALLTLLPFLVVDSTFLAANLLKIADGGYIPLILGALIIVAMWTWMRGTKLLADKLKRDSVPLIDFLPTLENSSAARVRGTAMFMTSTPDITPPALLHNLKHNKVLHEKNVVVTIHTAPVPYIGPEDRLQLSSLTPDFYKLEITYGFMQDPDLPAALAQAKGEGLTFDIMATSFFVGRRSYKPTSKEGMPLWQDRLFIYMARQAHDATQYFRIPAGRVVELGTQIVI